MLLLAHRIGLIPDIDANFQRLKVHLPYHESDHVLNIGSSGTTMRRFDSDASYCALMS